MRIIFLSEHDPLKRALKRNLVLATKDGTLNKSCVRTVLSSRDIPFLSAWREQPQLLAMSSNLTTNFAS